MKSEHQENKGACQNVLQKIVQMKKSP